MMIRRSIGRWFSLCNRYKNMVIVWFRIFYPQKGFYMATILRTINERAEYTIVGDVIIEGDIGNYAKITVRNGSLTIIGTVHQGASIAVEGNRYLPSSVKAFGFFAGCRGKALNPNHIVIHGKIEQGVQIQTDYGDITAKKASIANNTRLTTGWGSIWVGAIDSEATVEVGGPFGEILYGPAAIPGLWAS